MRTHLLALVLAGACAVDPVDTTIDQAIDSELIVPDGHCARELSPGQHITILVDYCPDGYRCPDTSPATWPLYNPVIEVLLCEPLGGLTTPFATGTEPGGLQGRSFNESFDGD